MYGNYEMMKRLAKDRVGEQLAMAEASRQASAAREKEGLLGRIVELLRSLTPGRRSPSKSLSEQQLPGQRIVPGTK